MTKKELVARIRELSPDGAPKGIVRMNKKNLQDYLVNLEQADMIAEEEMAMPMDDTKMAADMMEEAMREVEMENAMMEEPCGPCIATKLAIWGACAIVVLVILNAVI